MDSGSATGLCGIGVIFYQMVGSIYLSIVHYPQLLSCQEFQIMAKQQQC